MSRHVPRPELDNVPVRIVDVGGPAGARELEQLDLLAAPRSIATAASKSSSAMCSAKWTCRPPRPPISPTCGRHSPMRVRSPAITQIASRSGQRSTTGRPSTPA